MYADFIGVSVIFVASRSVILLIALAVGSAQQPPTPATDNLSPFLSVPRAPPPRSDEFRFAAQFPEFEAKDISGRRWRLEDLRGKFTLIYLWNVSRARALETDEGLLDRVPASLRTHLPESVRAMRRLPLVDLQRFYDESGNAKNIQVLTFCSDFDYMHAHDYMKEKGYTFPVIADWTLIGKLFPKDACTEPCSFGIPSPNPEAGMLGSPLWIVSPEGRLSYPFRYWTFGRVLLELERAAAAK